ncbi:MAG: hypothetical protein OEZ39_09395 [Gammaproteobacteria bacterium]|nr:hypothetical protein [Gammaproteobacteria bacterium]
MLNKTIICVLPVLGQPRHAKRVSMLKQSGFKVKVAAFERDYHKGRLPDCPVVSLGKISKGKYLQRVGKLIVALPKLRKQIKQSDLIYAFGSDMAMASYVAGTGLKKPIIFETGDVRSIQTSNKITGKLLRVFDRFITRASKLIVVTSPDFVANYFKKYLGSNTPYLVLENKIEPHLLHEYRKSKYAGNTITNMQGKLAFHKIGYFGLLRCEWSWQVLELLAKTYPDDVVIEIAGLAVEPADLVERVKEYPNIHYRGEFKSPDDLAGMYSGIDLVWGCQPSHDNNDVNFQSALSNRLYESCFYQRPIINRAGSGNAKAAERLGIGKSVGGSTYDAIKELQEISEQDMQVWKDNLSALPEKVYIYSTENDELKNYIMSLC